MKRFSLVFLALFACALAAGFSAQAGDSPVVSTMRNVNAVSQSRGYYILPAGISPEGSTGSLAPIQTFEVIRPESGAFTIGRLYTSCTCVQLQAPKRSFAAGERAVLELKNVRPTPVNGQMYAVYIQITKPVRVTLRYDTYVQSSQFAPKEEPETASAEKKTAVAKAGDAGLKQSDILGPANNEPEVKDGVETITVEKAKASASSVADALAQTLENHGEKAEEKVRETGLAASEAAEGSYDSIKEEAKAIASDMLAKAEKTDEAEKAIVEEAHEAIKEAEESVAEAEEAPKQEVKAPEAEEVKTPAATAAEPAAKEETEEEVPLPAGTIEQRISIITIGVANLEKSREFYEKIGWKPVGEKNFTGVVFYQMNGMLLSLYPISNLIQDQNRVGSYEAAPGSIVLGINMRSKAEVEEAYQTFLKAGGTSLKKPTEMPWGSVTCYVADPDGNPWEFSWVPQLTLNDKGELWID